MNDFLQKEIKKGIDPAMYSIVAQGMIMQYAATNPADAQATIETLTDPKIKQDCTAALVKKWADTDPFEAMGYVETFQIQTAGMQPSPRSCRPWICAGQARSTAGPRVLRRSA